MLSICYITRDLADFGGTEFVVIQLANTMVTKGYEVTIICLFMNEPVETLDSNVKVHVIKSHNWGHEWQTNSFLKRTWRQLYSRYTKIISAQLKPLLKKIKPDIIHTHKIRGFPVSLWEVIHEVLQVPIIHTCHDYELLSPFGIVSGSSKGSLWKWFSSIYTKPQKLDSKHVALVTAPSRYVLEQHLLNGWFATTQSKVVSNSFDSKLTSLTIITDTNTNRPIKVLFLGRLVPEKGTLVFLDALIQLKQDDYVFEAVIAGDGPERQLLENRVNNTKFVRLVGHVDLKQKCEWLNWADILIVPSLWEESFGIVAIEALAFGIPVIAANTGGLREVIDDGKNGFLVGRPGEIVNAREIATALKLFINDRYLLSKQSVLAKKSAERFQSRLIMHEWLKCYQNLST